MSKNIISDTDYTKGWDNRFATSVVIGRVSKVECTKDHANVRVIMPDRVDHEGTPLISKPVPVLQVASQAKKSFAMPRQDDQVLMVKMPNSTSNYVVIGSFYTKTNPPPVTDPNLDYVVYDDGSIMQFDASTGELTWKLKGDMLWDNEKDFTLKTKGDVSIEIDGDILLKPKGDVTVTPDGDVLIQAARGKITLDSPMGLYLQGDIHHTGNMVTSGHHTDAKGPHAASVERDELLNRVDALERRVLALEAALKGLYGH
jgi:phage baseplate assembly protein V